MFKNIHSSLKYRLIFLCFLLVFVAMTIVGVFIVKEFKDYNINIIRQDMDNIANNLVRTNLTLKKDNLIENKDVLQVDMQNMPISTGYEISIIDPSSYTIIASTNPRFQDVSSFEILDKNTILRTVTEDRIEKDIEIKSNEGAYYIKNIAYTQKDNGGSLKYIIYIRSSLDGMNKMLNNIISMLIKSVAIALLATFILGYLLSSTITKPVNILTKKALKMSEGDFSQRAEVYSNDEVGQLAVAFNYLTEQIENMIIKIDSEKEKLDAIIYHMQNGLCAVDTSGNIIHSNPMFKDFLRINEQTNIIGNPYDKEVYQYQDEIGFEKINSLAEEKNTKGITVQIYGKYIKVTSAFFKNENQQNAGIIAIFQDINETKMLEELRKEFVANVSHELKTPITSIKGYSETLLEGAIEEKEISRNFLNIILSEADRMNQIIKDLLQLSHIDYKKETWDMKNSDMNELVRKCIKKMKIYAETKNQKIIDKTTNEKYIVKMDNSKMEQTIINLISNAIKYSKENGTITLSTILVDNWCEISISDTGIGISKENIKRIFDRFYRVDKGRSRSLGGTGLGLSIVKAIIDEHKGEIYVKSKTGEGSTFLVRLPVNN